MIEIGLCLIQRLNRELPRRRALPQARELRENPPHPMGDLLATADFGKCRCISEHLHLGEAFERVIAGHKNSSDTRTGSVNFGQSSIFTADMLCLVGK